MRELLNENTLFATVAMYLSESSTLVLVVEGDDDHLTLKDHCSPDLRLIAGTGGRPQVLKTAALAHQRGLRGVRFLIDRDYDSYVEDSAECSDNVFISETHDCFIDILMSDGALLVKLIDVHTASARRRPEGGSPVPAPEKIREDAVALACQLAAVRVVDAQKRLLLDFKKFSFGSLKVRDFNARAIAEKVLTRSLHIGEGVGEILDSVEQVHEEIARLPQPPIGDHDLFQALARILKRADIAVSDRELKRGFILAITCTALTGTKWFQEVQEWCATTGRTGFTCRTEATLAA